LAIVLSVCLLLAIVLSVFFWPLYCLSSFGHCIVCLLLAIVLYVFLLYTLQITSLYLQAYVVKYVHKVWLRFLCSVFISQFFFLSFFFLAIVLFVRLRITAYEYRFGIFKLFAMLWINPKPDIYSNYLVL
jgi:hypothetical protein